VPQTRIDFPLECLLKREANLKIQLTGYKFPKLNQLTLDVPVTASSFEKSYSCRQIVLSASGNSEEITFPLVPLERGEQVIQIEFFLESVRVGYYLVKTKVIERS